MLLSEIDILLIEPNKKDALLTRSYLEKIKGFSINITAIESVDGACDYLTSVSPSIILLSVSLPDSTGLSEIKKIVSVQPSAPVVVLTHSGTNGFAVQSIHAGAQDYLLKDKMDPDTIRRSILYSIERKKNESALQESEMRFKELANQLPQIVFETDANANLTFANELAFSTFGYSNEDFSNNLSALQMIVPEERQIAKENIVKILKGEKSNQPEYTAIRKDGTKFPVQIISTTIIRNGMTLGLRGVIMDLSERKASRENMARLSRAVEQSPASVMITDLDGNIQYVNPKFVQTTGYTMDEVKGKNPNILKSGFTTMFGYKELWSTITSGNEWRGEFHNKKKNGELYWESASISPITDNEGNIINYLAVKEDITQQKIFEKELIKAKEKAEESDKLKTEFLAQMSHEIRTPLHSLLNYSRIIREESSNSPGVNGEISSYLDGIEKAGKRIIRTMDLILNVSQIQTGSYELMPEFINIYDDILSAVYLEYSPMAEMAGLEFSLSKESENTMILSDRYSVHKIVENLVDNAIKFTSGGSVNMAIGRTEEEKLYIKVTDTGIGISEKYLKKMFVPFSQEKQGYSRPFDGNGLGLALIKKYCDLNLIDISVKSKKGSGTTFILTFPS